MGTAVYGVYCIVGERGVRVACMRKAKARPWGWWCALVLEEANRIIKNEKKVNGGLYIAYVWCLSLLVSSFVKP